MSRLSVLVLLLMLGATSAHAQPTPNERQLRDKQLSFLDADAGLILSLKLPQLQAAHALASEMLPEERQAINLAGLGAGAILGFYPFSAKAWSASGFDIKTPLIAQVAATDPGDAILRTRIVLKARNMEKARNSIQRMRIRDKARPHVTREALLPLLAGVRDTPSEAQARKRLSDAGVFLIGKPLPLSGLLFAQTRGDFLIFDILDPKGQTFDKVITMLSRTPKALSGASRGAEVLVEGPMGLWIRAAPLGSTLSRLATSDPERSQGCRTMANLGKASSIQSLSIRADLAKKSISLEASWNLKPASGLLEVFTASHVPLLGGHGLVDARIGFSNWSGLRDRPRPLETQSWDSVWAQSRTCGQASQAYLVSVAWPEILGLFLSELSIIHPTAATAIEALGGMTAQIGVGKHSRLTYFTEAWIAREGAGIAKGWLKTLFGSERIAAGKHRWGDGAIRPYALDLVGGSVVGAGYRPGSRQFALSSSGRPTAPVSAKPTRILASLRANPAALATELGSLPRPNLWRPWHSLSTAIETGEQKLKLTLSLQRSDDR